MSNVTAWYYAINGQQNGPVDWQSLVALAQTGAINPDTPVWGGEGDWRPASQTSLGPMFVTVKPSGPPPLTGMYVSNAFVWAIVAVPMVNVAGGMVWGASASAGILGWAIFGLNVLFCVLDEKRLKAAGHKAPPGWWALLVPVYLWKRATLLRQNRLVFASWCASFVASVFLLGSLETKARVLCNPTTDTFLCVVTHEQGSETVNVCWDVVIVCAGGVRAVGHACQVVGPQQTASRAIPESEIQQIAQCRNATSITVENLTIATQ
jgi:hypothetical protein